MMTYKRKLRFTPLWTDLERVVPVVQSQTVNGVRVTLVSVEVYSTSGYLLTFVIEAQRPEALHMRAARGQAHVTLVDQDGRQYRSLTSTIDGRSNAHVFRGRTVMAYTSRMAPETLSLTVTLDAIQWEYAADAEVEGSFEDSVGPWQFQVNL